MKDGVVRRVTYPLWWIGWRPAVTASVCGAAGILAGYFRGWFSAGTAALAVVVVAVGVLVPLVRRAGFVAAVGTFFVFFFVGTERVERAFERLGTDIRGTAENVSAVVLDAASSVGVETASEPTAAGTVGREVAGVAFWSLVGVVVGAAVWLLGVSIVNLTYAGVREELVGRVREKGEDILDGDGTLHTLTHGKGSMRLVRPAEKYRVTNALVGASSVCLHHGFTVDMPSQDVETRDRTNELYYDQIVSVDYEEPRVRISRTDGKTISIVTSEKPVALVEEVEERLQEYKAKSESDRTGEGSRRRKRSDDDVALEGGSSVDETTVVNEEGSVDALEAEEEMEEAEDAKEEEDSETEEEKVNSESPAGGTETDSDEGREDGENRNAPDSDDADEVAEVLSDGEKDDESDADGEDDHPDPDLDEGGNT